MYIVINYTRCNIPSIIKHSLVPSRALAQQRHAIFVYNLPTSETPFMRFSGGPMVALDCIHVLAAMLSGTAYTGCKWSTVAQWYSAQLKIKLSQVRLTGHRARHYLHYPALMSIGYILKFGSRPEKTCLRWFANNTGADQPAHPRILISALVIRLLKSIISRLATGERGTLICAHSWIFFKLCILITHFIRTMKMYLSN